MGTFEILGLEKTGITECSELHRNLSYEELFEHETDPALEGLERGVVTSNGAVTVDTGRFTGRWPKAKFFVKEDTSKENIWWAGPERRGSDNKPISEEVWEHLRALAVEEPNGERLYVVDGFAGTNPATRLNVRVICEVVWQAHFSKDKFSRPTEEAREACAQCWPSLNASNTPC